MRVRTTMRVTLTTVVAAAALLSGCAAASAHYNSVTALRDAATTAGYVCKDWRMADPGHAVESGMCDNSAMAIYGNEEIRDAALEEWRSGNGGDRAKIRSSALVGSNWIMFWYSETTAVDLQGALGGRLVSIGGAK